MSTVSASPLLQNTLVDFLSHHHYEKHLRQLRKELEKHKKVFYQQLKKRLNPACKIHYYSSGYFLWIELPAYLDGYTIYEQLIQNNIGIAPSQLFRSEQVSQNFIRLNCSFAWNSNIAAALDVLSEVIQQHITQYTHA